MRFEVFSKEVEIKGEKYTLRPLSGRYIPKLYSIIASFSGDDKDMEDMDDADWFKSLDETTVSKIHELAMQTFTTAYPQEDKDKIDLFVSQNLMQILPVLFDLNLEVGDLADKEEVVKKK